LTKALEQIIANPSTCESWQAASWAGRNERTWANYRRNVAQLVSRM